MNSRDRGHGPTRIERLGFLQGMDDLASFEPIRSGCRVRARICAFVVWEVESGMGRKMLRDMFKARNVTCGGQDEGARVIELGARMINC